MSSCPRLILAASFLSFGMSSQLIAREQGILGASPTFQLDVTYGFATYKSEMVASNDTGTGLTYALGGWAGEERDLGFLMRTDSSTIAFELNESEVTTVWQDNIIRYRLGPVYLGVVFSHVDALVNRAGTELVDAEGAGTGGNFGIMIPIKRKGVTYMDVTTATIAKTRNALTDETAYGARSDVDLGASFDMAGDWLDFLVGYRQRNMAITTDAGSHNEIFTITYLGFRLATFF